MPLREVKWRPRISQEAYLEDVLEKLRLGWGRAEMGHPVEITLKLGWQQSGRPIEPLADYHER